MKTKYTSKAIVADCQAAIRLIAEGRNSVTAILTRCETEAHVLLACSTFAEAVKIEDKQIQPYLTRTWQNSVTQYVTRCRNGEIKLPATWFDPSRTVSFASDPFAFAEYKPRNTANKSNKQAEAEAQAEAVKKQAEAQAEAMLEDKATLTKAQAAKVSKAQAEAQAQADKAQALAKQAQANATEAQAQAAKVSKALAELTQTHEALKADYAKALRQIEALKKALGLARVEAEAIEALIKHA